jgi:hypothetical protein
MEIVCEPNPRVRLTLEGLALIAKVGAACGTSVASFGDPFAQLTLLKEVKIKMPNQPIRIGKLRRMKELL